LVFTSTEGARKRPLRFCQKTADRFSPGRDDKGINSPH
jgi:hypothetical protein